MLRIISGGGHNIGMHAWFIFYLWDRARDHKMLKHTATVAGSPRLGIDIADVQ